MRYMRSIKSKSLKLCIVERLVKHDLEHTPYARRNGLTISTPVSGVMMIFVDNYLFTRPIFVYCEDKTIIYSFSLLLIMYYYKTTIYAEMFVCMIISVGSSTRKKLKVQQNN